MNLTCSTRAPHCTSIAQVPDLNKGTISNNADTPPVITSPVPTMQWYLFKYTAEISVLVSIHTCSLSICTRIK